MTLPPADATGRSTAGPIARPPRLLGVDLGDRRMGIALADPASGVIRPLATVTRRDVARDAAAIGRLADEHGAVELIVGSPLHLDGREGEQAAATRAWSEAIGRIVAIPVRLRDERLTSVTAESHMPRRRRGASGGAPSRVATRTHRARIDREAAVLILRAELDSREAVR